MLDETRALTKDNHRMLRAIRRDQWIGFFGKIIFWLVVLVLPIYFYQQYLKPLTSLFAAPSDTATSTSSGFGFPTTTELQKLINSYRTGQ